MADRQVSNSSATTAQQAPAQWVAAQQGSAQQGSAIKLATPSGTREVLEVFGLATKKRLGQNFLVNEAIVEKICDLADMDPNSSCVLEVGPGIGTLTQALLARSRAVVSIEADKNLKPVYGLTLAPWLDKFALLEGDALKVSADDVRSAFCTLLSSEISGAAPLATTPAPSMFVANLPYKVAATVLLKFISEFLSLSRAVVMVQAEVADRIAAVPGTKTYGAYTVKLQLYSKVTGRFEVGPHNFFPPPRVNSAVVRLDRQLRKDPYTGKTLLSDDLSCVTRLVDAAFAQRRKTLRNCLYTAGYVPELVEYACEETSIEPTLRAEALSVDDFIRLALTMRNAVVAAADVVSRNLTPLSQQKHVK